MQNPKKNKKNLKEVKSITKPYTKNECNQLRFNPPKISNKK